MRIIKRGKSKEQIDNSPLRLTCTRCETEIETSLGEMLFHEGVDANNDFYEIKCPECDRMITFYPQAISGIHVSGNTITNSEQPQADSPQQSS